jgi:hypothetical protein
MKRLLTVVAATAALTLPAAPALAASAAPTSTQAPAPRCTVHAVLLDATHVQISENIRCRAPYVTVQSWLSTTADGRPLPAQRLLSTAYDGLFEPGLTVVTVLAAAPAYGCYEQIDVAYGHPHATLDQPYGGDLIAAWHLGNHDCTNPPSSPPASSSPPSAPAPSSPATTPPVVTTPPTTAPVPTTPAVTPTHTPTLVPPVHLTKTPTAKPSKTHRPRKTPTATTTPPAPAPSASGCVASGCHTPPPSSPPQLPFTGTPPALMYELLYGSAALVAGLGLVALAARRRS